MLFVSEMFSHIAGLPYDASEALLEEIFGYLHAPENIYTHEWRQNDLVLWDNRAVHHGRPSFHGSGGVRTARPAAGSSVTCRPHWPGGIA